MVRPIVLGRRREGEVCLRNGGPGASPGTELSPSRDGGSATPKRRGVGGSEVLKIIAGLVVALGVSLLIRHINSNRGLPAWHL